MASASAMTYTPSVSSGANPDSENTSATVSSSCDNELLTLDISTNGTSRSSNKRSYFDRAYLTFPSDAESPKKRRKQSTPVKITSGATDSEQAVLEEGKLEQPNSSCSPVLDSSTPSPEVFTPPVKRIAEERETSPNSAPAPASDLFKLDFGAPSWMSDIHNKPPEEWLNTPPLHNVPFSFPSLQSPALPGQLPLMDVNQQSGLLLSRPLNQPRIRIFNPDAYCELCNKEFCNKYFLKTHKANKHGIYTDLPPNEINYMPGQIKVTGERGATPPLKLQDTPPKISTPLLPPSCDICQKKFTHKGMIKRHKIKVHGIVYDSDPENNDNSNTDQNISDSNSETHQITVSPNSNYQGEAPSTVPECLKPFLDTEFDSDNVQQFQRWPISIHSPSTLNQQVREAIHRPRGLGIVNPEAFCEICCKEYCNKYFLRTHKLKRHGIAIPNDDPPVPGTKDGDTRNMQTSPLNLIKSEQNSNESKDDVMMCGICGVHVSQKYMKAHYEACHTTGRTSSPLSNKSNNDELNTSETASNDKADNDSSINEDLKKLQTMILQLNNLNVCQIVTCNVCCKEFENKFYLQAHMMSDHGQLYMKITDEKISIQTTTPVPTEIAPPVSKPPTEIPKIEIEPRLTAPQQIDLNTMPRSSQMSTPTNLDRRQSISLAPTNSYCEICNKELCNKYFMKTHMQRMHGIEIENGAQIGGVVCNICNKELCSKYFLRVHKHNTHGIVEDGGGITTPMAQIPSQPSLSKQATNDDSNQPTPTTSSDPPINDVALKPSDITDLNHRYFAHFTEVCPICSRRFRSTKWLKAHLVTDHGKLDDPKWEELDLMYNKHKQEMINDVKAQDPEEDSPNVGIQSLLSNIFGQDDFNSKKYYCTSCNFSTPVLAFLFVHERSHGPPTSKNTCPICSQTYRSSELLQQHILVQHKPILPSISDKKPLATLPLESPKTPSPIIKTEQLTEEHETSSILRRLTPNDVAQNLSEISKQMQLPTTYALPHHQYNVELGAGIDHENENNIDEKYMMQPFLIEELRNTENNINSDLSVGQSVQLRLVPSLVYLPVREKVTTPLTTSIKLTPT